MPRRSSESASPWRSVRARASTSGTSGDRKSTRLNSSHVSISYAVFCLKKNIDQRNQYDTSKIDQQRPENQTAITMIESAYGSPHPLHATNHAFIYQAVHNLMCSICTAH